MQRTGHSAAKLDVNRIWQLIALTVRKDLCCILLMATWYIHTLGKFEELVVSSNAEIVSLGRRVAVGDTLLCYAGIAVEISA